MTVWNGAFADEPRRNLPVPSFRRTPEPILILLLHRLRPAAAPPQRGKNDADGPLPARAIAHLAETTFAGAANGFTPSSAYTSLG